MKKQIREFSSECPPNKGSASTFHGPHVEPVDQTPTLPRQESRDERPIRSIWNPWVFIFFAVFNLVFLAAHPLKPMADPQVILHHPDPEVLDIDRSQLQSATLVFPLEIQNLDETQWQPGYLQWRWRSNDAFWTGDSWTTQGDGWLDVSGNAHAFWQNVTVTGPSGEITASFPSTSFTEVFWQGTDRVITVEIRYGGPVAYHPAPGLTGKLNWQDLKVVLLPSPAPWDLEPVGSIADPSPTFTWSQVAGADSYLIGIQAPDGTWLDPNWQNQTVSGTQYTPTTPLEPHGTYRILAAAVNRAGLSRFYANRTVVYQPELPQTPGTVSTGGEPNEAFPQLSWAAVPGAQTYRLGLLDPEGNWVDPDWRQKTIAGTSTQPETPLIPNRPYKVFLVADNPHGSRQTVTGSIVVTPQDDPSLTFQFNGESQTNLQSLPLDPRDTGNTFQVSRQVNLLATDDVYLEFKRPGQVFDGVSWVAAESQKPWSLNVTAMGNSPFLNNPWLNASHQFGETGSNEIRFEQFWQHMIRYAPFFFDGPLQIEVDVAFLDLSVDQRWYVVPHDPSMLQLDYPKLDLTIAQTNWHVFHEDVPLHFEISVKSPHEVPNRVPANWGSQNSISFSHFPAPGTHGWQWLLLDTQTQKCWNGSNWVPGFDQLTQPVELPPWLTLNEDSNWPGLDLATTLEGPGHDLAIDASFNLSGRMDTFFDHGPEKRLRLIVRNRGQENFQGRDQVYAYPAPELTISSAIGSFLVELNANLGREPLDPTVDAHVLTRGDPESLTASADTIAEPATIQDDYYVALRLYQDDGGLNPVATTSAMTLAEVSSGTTLKTEMANLLTGNMVPERDYYLVGFITIDPFLNGNPGEWQPYSPANGGILRLNFNGLAHLPLTSLEENHIRDRGFKFIYIPATELVLSCAQGDCDLNIVDGASQREIKFPGIGLPAGQAAANFDDIFKHQHGGVFKREWRMIDISNGAVVREKVNADPADDSFNIGGGYDEHKTYRLEYKAYDRYNLSAQQAVTFASIRDLGGLTTHFYLKAHDETRVYHADPDNDLEHKTCLRVGTSQISEYRIHYVGANRSTTSSEDIRPMLGVRYQWTYRRHDGTLEVDEKTVQFDTDGTPSRTDWPAQQRGLNCTSQIPGADLDAPFPMEWRVLQVEDLWSGKNYGDYTPAGLKTTLVWDEAAHPINLCTGCNDQPPPPPEHMDIEPLVFDWPYHTPVSALVLDAADLPLFQSLIRFDPEDYDDNPANWQIVVAFVDLDAVNPPGSEAQITLPLEQFLSANHQGIDRNLVPGETYVLNVEAMEAGSPINWSSRLTNTFGTDSFEQIEHRYQMKFRIVSDDFSQVLCTQGQIPTFGLVFGGPVITEVEQLSVCEAPCASPQNCNTTPAQLQINPTHNTSVAFALDTFPSDGNCQTATQVDPARFQWAWQRGDGFYWDDSGETWVPGDPLWFDLGLPGSLFENCTISDNTYQIQASFPQNVFPQGFFDAETQIELTIHLKYVRNGITISSANQAQVDFQKLSPGQPLVSLNWGSLPNQIQVARAGAQEVAFGLPFEAESTNGVPATDVDETLFKWRIKKVGETAYWDGHHWVAGEIWQPFGSAVEDAFSLFRYVQLDWPNRVLTAAIPPAYFYPEFFDDAQDILVEIQLGYDVETGGQNTRTPLATLAVATVGAQTESDDPFSYLVGLGDLDLAYAPEPMTLSGDTLFHMIGNGDGFDNLDPDLFLPDQPIVLNGNGSDPHLYTWFQLDAQGVVHFNLFIVPYGENQELLHETLSQYETRTTLVLERDAVSSVTWKIQSNLAYRFFEDGTRLVAAVFVPESHLDWGKPFDRGQDATTPPPTLVHWDAIRNTVDPSHNRSLAIQYLDRSGQRKLFTIGFTDLLGRAQETHAIGNIQPAVDDLLGNKMLVSGIETFDEMGRSDEVVKGFYTSGATDPLAFASAPLRQTTRAAAENFWKVDLDWTLGDQEPFAKTLYENHARGRVVASLPLGAAHHDRAGLRYLRYHYFTVAAPTLANFDNATFHSLPLDQATGEAILMGILTVDPNGQVSASFGGSEALLEIANPSKTLMEVWGLQVLFFDDIGQLLQNGHQPKTVFLPFDNANHYQTHHAQFPDATNLVVLNHVDTFGRLRHSFPPKTLQLNEANWEIALLPQHAGLAIEYQVDAFDRVIRQIEPDAGTSQFLYNRRGQLRFSQDAQQAQLGQWTESIYDDVGRVVLVRQIDSPGEPTASQIEARIGTQDALPFSEIHTFFDAYSNFSQTRVLPLGFKPTWPTEDTLKNINPFVANADDIVLSAPFGLVSQIIGPQSAERFYYDERGRVICRVYLLRHLAEPFISWFEYSPAHDLPLRSYSHQQQQALSYHYDAWNRLTSIKDLSPEPIRLQVKSKGSGPSLSHRLGPLVNAIPSGDPSQPLSVTQVTHTPTGHPYILKTGDPALQSLSIENKYDIRDWLLETKAHTVNDGELLYKTELGYAQGADHPMFDGTITSIRETYGDHLPAEEVRVITHQYRYDPLLQLAAAHSDWQGITIDREYSYDRNGNRTAERRINGPVNENYDRFYEHTLHQGTNRLSSVTEDAQEYITIGSDGYDALGNVRELRKKIGVLKYVRQTLTYEDPLNPQLPTRIVQVPEDPPNPPDPPDPLDPELHIVSEFAYDHTGTRIWRSLVKHDEQGQPLAAEITTFLPSGLENEAELDRFGRTQRAYLVAGDQRIGFKTPTDTAYYIKDHLGSTKATLVLSYPDEVGARLFETDLTSSMAHHWALDGDLLDGVPEGITATLNGTGSMYLGGVSDLALQLTGAGDYLDLGLPSPFTDDPAAFTAALWVRIDADLTTTTATHAILSNRDGTNGGLTLLMESHTNGTASGTLTLYTYQPGGSDMLKTTTGNHFPNDGQWHYLVVTQNGDQGVLYLDGHPLVEGTLSPAATSNTTVKLGANHSGSNQYLPGTLDEVTILNRPMTLGEVQKTYYVSAAALQSSFPAGGLTGFFDLDGDTKDASGLQPDGQITGDPIYGPGVVGDGLVLDGVDDGVNLGNPAGFDAQVGDFSVSLWVKLGLSLDAENSLLPILSNAQNNTGMELQLKLHPDPNLNGVLYFYTYQNGAFTRLWTDAGAFPDDGQWHHIAATRNGSSGKLYLDGVLVEGKTLAAPDDATAPLWLGSDPAGRVWPGALDQVRLYDRALASHEVLAHFLNADQRYGLWTGDSTVEDASGNAHHGTPLGSATYEPGIKGQALSFNGTNDTLDLGNPPAFSQGLTSFSVTAWVRLDKTLGSEDVDHTLMSNKDATQGGFTIKLEDHTSTAQTGRIKVSCYNGGTTDSLTGTGHHYLADQDWHQVAFTLEGGTGTLYVDGLQIASKTMLSPGDSTNGLYLGSHLGSSNHWIGALDEVQFYRRGLQAEEIQSDYLTWAPASHRNPLEDPGLTAQWDFDNNYDNAKDAQNPAVPSTLLGFEEGKLNDALQLDGTAMVDLGTSADVTLDNGTITLWVKLNANQLGSSTGRYVLLSNHDTDSGFRLIIDDDTDPAQAGSIQLTTYSETTTTALTSGSIHWPNDATWHHLAVTKANQTASMYLDGTLIATVDNLVQPGENSHAIHIGTTGTGTPYPWSGMIDQVKIFTTALSPYQILGTYLEGNPQLTEGASRGEAETRFLLLASDTDPYGLQLRESYNPNQENTEPHGFTGQEKEPDFGLYYYGGRWYFKEGGRFLQVDPMREFWNSYSYVGNDPINLTDPTGECVDCGLWIIGTIRRAGEVSEAQHSADGTGIIAQWEVDGVYLGAHELKAYEEGLPMEFILYARDRSTRDVVKGMDVYRITYDGFGNEIDRYDIAQRNALNLAFGILFQRVFFGKAPTTRQSLNQNPKLLSGVREPSKIFRDMGSFSGKSVRETRKILEANGFKFMGRSEGGYIKFYRTVPNGPRVQVHIRPNGQVVRSVKGTGQRFDFQGRGIEDHNAGEFLKGNFSGN